MKINIQLRKEDMYHEFEEEVAATDYLDAVKKTLAKYSKLGYSVAKVTNLEPESSFQKVVADHSFDPKN